MIVKSKNPETVVLARLDTALHLASPSNKFRFRSGLPATGRVRTSAAVPGEGSRRPSLKVLLKLTV
jgi:hypothetical protein